MAPTQQRENQTGVTHKAREEAAGIIDPNLSVVVKDPLRVQILAVAMQRPISPSEFAHESGCSLGAAAYHFRTLVKHGFLELVELIPVRGSTKHMYRATKSGYISDHEWGKVEQALRPGIAGAILQDFNNLVTQAMEAGTFSARDDTCMYWESLVLDEVSWPKFVAMLAWAVSEAKECEVETVQRRASGESHETIPVTFAIAGFESPAESESKAKAKRKRSPSKAKTKAKSKRKTKS